MIISIDTSLGDFLLSTASCHFNNYNGYLPPSVSLGIHSVVVRKRPVACKVVCEIFFRIVQLRIRVKSCNVHLPVIPTNLGATRSGGGTLHKMIIYVLHRSRRQEWSSALVADQSLKIGFSNIHTWTTSELLTGLSTLTHSPLRTCILYGTTWALTRSYMRHRLPKAGAYGVMLRPATDSILPQILGCRAVRLSVCQYIDELTCFEFAWLEIDPAILPQNLLMAAPSRRETCGSSPDRPCRNNLPMLLHGGYKSDVTALGSSTLLTTNRIIALTACESIQWGIK